MIPFTRLGLQQMQMLGAGAPTAGLPRFITDLFNLLQSSPTYTGGPLTATDYEGNLVTSPAGVPALEGGRLATTVAEGAKLGPELFPTVDLTTWITAGTITTETVNTFTSSGPAGKALAGGSLTIAKRYQATLTGTSSTVLWSLKDSVGTGTDPDVMSTNGTVEFVSTKGGIYFRNTNTGTFTLGTLSVREVIPTWYDTELDGTPIQPSISIPTRSGTKQWYQEPFANPFGYSNWPARTNKCTCRKFNPVDTTNLTKSGDAAAVLSVVDDTAALTAAGLDKICTSGKVYKLDNSAGGSISWVQIIGNTDNVNPHSYSIRIRTASAGVSLRFQASAVLSSAPSTNAYSVVVGENIIPTDVNRKLELVIPSGAIAYFILPQLEEGSFATPPIFDPLNDSLTSITRAATNLTDPLTLGPQLQLVVIPAATGTAGTLLDDGTNKLSYNGTNLIFTDGVTTLSAAATLTAGTAYAIGVKGLDGDWALSVNGTDIDTDTGSLVVWGTAKLGRNDADGDYFAGYFPNCAGYVGTDINWYKTNLGA